MNLHIPITLTQGGGGNWTASLYLDLNQAPTATFTGATQSLALAALHTFVLANTPALTVPHYYLPQ